MSKIAMFVIGLALLAWMALVYLIYDEGSEC